MITNKEKYINDIDLLIKRGVTLQRGLYNELRNEYEEAFNNLSDEDNKLFLNAKFKEDYHAWYNESLALIKQLVPERLEDFSSFYRLPKRKDSEISILTYTISDYLVGAVVRDALGSVIADGKIAVKKFEQQLLMVTSLKKRFESSLYDIKQLVQADTMDSEIESVKVLLKNGFYRAAGAICGVVLEKHFELVCNIRNIKLKKKNPCINDYNQLLKDEGIIDTPTWRRISYYADIRNLCDHNKKEEPNKEQLQDLVNGTEKVIKTIF